MPWIALTLILGFALGGSYVSAFLQAPQGPVQPQHSEANEPASYNEKEETERRLAEYTYWLMLFTGMLAIATIGLGIATYGLYRTGEKQIGLVDRQITAADDTAQRQLRAYPGVTGAYIRFESNKISIRFLIRNFNSTPAYGFRYAISHQLCAPGDSVVPVRAPFRDSIWDMAAGAMSKMEDFGTLAHGQYEGLLLGDLVLYVWGRAEYQDAFKQPRHIEFLYRCSDIQADVEKTTNPHGLTQTREVHVCTEPDAIQYESN